MENRGSGVGGCRRGNNGRGIRFRPYEIRGGELWGHNRRLSRSSSSMAMPPPPPPPRVRRPTGSWRRRLVDGSGSGRRRWRGRRGVNYNDSRLRPIMEIDEAGHSQQHLPTTTTTTIEPQVLVQYEKNYPGYQLYFPISSTLPTTTTTVAAEVENPMEKLDAVKQFLIRNKFVPTSKVAEDIEDNEYYDVKYEAVLDDQMFMEAWASFPDELLNKPQSVLNIWGLAMHTVVFEELTQKEDEIAAQSGLRNDGLVFKKKVVKVPPIHVRLMKRTPITPLRAINASLLGMFITVRGAVLRIGQVRPQCTSMTFSCNDCDCSIVIKQPEGRFTEPTQCSNTLECAGRSFEPMLTESTTKLVDSRKIRLQDIRHSDMEAGQVPRVIDCMLFNDLVKFCNAGDAVTVCGIVKMDEDGSGKYGGDHSLYNLYIEVVALFNHKDSERTMGGNWFSFTNKDYYAVREIHDTENLFRLLVASLCPTIYGHDMVKAGLLLCLFGGTPAPTSSTISRRSNINILIVGDPGLGKSQLLNVISEVAPRGVYVCGTASSVAGLTVTLVKDGDDYSLEAGALVMADQGICCIDEFDKMQAQHHALLEAMEQGSISIAKSGVFRTLPARTSVIAAANPVDGHYNRGKTIAENVQVAPALLSRFDLTFILLDKSDEKMDKNIADHIMGLRKPQASLDNVPSASSSLGSVVRASVPDQDSSMTTELLLPLCERLKMRPDDNDDLEVDLIPHALIRKYIAYAKHYVHPVLSKEAAAVIKEYYLRLRVKHCQQGTTTSVTARQLESLIRLSQARAKLELRETVTEQDAKDVLEIFEFGMSSVFVDHDYDGEIGLEGVPSRSSSKATTKKNAKRLVSNLQRLAEERHCNIFTMDEIKRIGGGIGLVGVENLLSILNNDGILLNKGGGAYQLQSVNI